MARSCSPFRHPAGWPVFFARSMPSGPDTDVRRQANYFVLDCLGHWVAETKKETLRATDSERSKIFSSG